VFLKLHQNVQEWKLTTWGKLGICCTRGSNRVTWRSGGISTAQRNLSRGKGWLEHVLIEVYLIGLNCSHKLS